ncbi:MAG: Tol-Pal system protein TolB [Betaproteobacteria bacterium]|nr:Tol-Pal system protein TolB [Betaproteobacteria bacterium]
MKRWFQRARDAILVAIALLAALPAHAQLTIEIIGGGATQTPIAIVPFAGEAEYPLGVTGVVGADLQRSGLFKLVDAGAARPANPLDVRYPEFRARGAEAIVVGSMMQTAPGLVNVRFFLLDAVKQTQITAFSYNVAPGQFRAVAHKIADVIYEAMTGDKGVFSTRIAYIVKQGRRHMLQVADADGYNPQTIVNSDEPLLSPAWSPDGTRLAYVSFEARKPVVYIQDLASGRKQALANFKGNNSAPAWSPDSRKLVVTLTKDGNSQMYLINADGNGAQRIATSSAIDTEANFAPDGASLLFVSDRGGSPQIYRFTLATGAVERVSFDGSYNTTPRHAPDGKSFAFLKRDGNRFNIAVQDIASRQVQVLTQGGNDESPSFAPNGRMILYASGQGGRGILAAVSSDGRVKQRLSSAVGGDVREPAWGPLGK